MYTLANKIDRNLLRCLGLHSMIEELTWPPKYSKTGLTCGHHWCWHMWWHRRVASFEAQDEQHHARRNRWFQPVHYPSPFEATFLSIKWTQLRIFAVPEEFRRHRKVVQLGTCCCWSSLYWWVFYGVQQNSQLCAFYDYLWISWKLFSIDSFFNHSWMGYFLWRISAFS